MWPGSDNLIQSRLGSESAGIFISLSRGLEGSEYEDGARPMGGLRISSRHVAFLILPSMVIELRYFTWWYEEYAIEK